MKHLKWFIAIFALFVVPFGVNAAPALAGNCTSAYVNPAVSAGSAPYRYPDFTEVVGNCTSVSLIQFAFPGISGGSPAAICGDIPNVCINSNIVFNAYPSNTITNYEDPTTSPTWYTYIEYANQNPWGPCSSSNTWWTVTSSFRIQSIDIHGVKTWGPWHSVTYGAPDHDCF